MEKIGRRIRRIREKHELTQDYVAHRLNISQNAYSRIESGETKLTVERLNEIAQVYDMDMIGFLGYLLSLDDKVLIEKVSDNHGHSTNGIVIQYSSSESDREMIQHLQNEIKFLRELLLTGKKLSD